MGLQTPVDGLQISFAAHVTPQQGLFFLQEFQSPEELQVFVPSQASTTQVSTWPAVHTAPVPQSGSVFLQSPHSPLEHFFVPSQPPTVHDFVVPEVHLHSPSSHDSPEGQLTPQQRLFFTQSPQMPWHCTQS
jgi:hypothetical protein